MHAKIQPEKNAGPRRVPNPPLQAAGVARPALGTTSPQAIAALQRAAGNAAVARMVEEQQGTEGREDGQAVQRSAVHSVLRSAGQPLDEPLRTEMESRLGTDFSDVRVHSDGVAQRSAAEVGARAYTSGNHVVIGRGGADKHTLAHELTHVIQQRSGPVAGTDDGSGLSVSDPSDHFERAAEDNARRVMSGPAPAHRAAEAPPAPAAEATAVQRVSDDQEYDELHSNPQGTALRVRGPRPSKSSNRPELQIADLKDWDLLSETQRNAYKQRLNIHDDPQTLRETDLILHSSLRELARKLLGKAAQGLNPNERLERAARQDKQAQAYWNGQDARAKGLTRQAAERQHTASQEGSRRPDREQVEASIAGAASPAERMQALLQGHDGVAISAPKHRDSKVWGFFIDNIAMLREQGVRTFYLESLRDDSYQSLVDEYLSGTSNEMPQRLRRFTQSYDDGNSLGNRGLNAFLPVARQHKMQVKGIDGHPARRITGEDLFLRAARMNTYAEQAVLHDRTRRGDEVGKYLMELGKSHATLHPAPSSRITSHGAEFTQEFPGMSDLLGVPPVLLSEDGNTLEQLP